MRAEEIVIGEYYAVGGTYWSAENQYRRGQVIGAVDEHYWLVRFRQPMVRSGRYLTVDKASGSQELEFESDCLLKTWAEHMAEKKHRLDEKERLGREEAEIQKTLDELGEKLHTLGYDDDECRLISDTRYVNGQYNVVARLLLSHTSLLAILEALEKIDNGNSPGSVIGDLLGEGK